jgi:DNA-binding PadR family transcriptional regulator
VHDLTDGHIKWTTGTLYPLLHSLENKRLVASFYREEESGPGPKRKYYRITEKGKKKLVSEKQEWLRVHQALEVLWRPLPGIASA